MDSIEVREATLADLDALLSLYTELSPANAGLSREQAVPVFETLLGREGVALFVAVRAGRVIGTVTLVIVPNLTHHAQPWAQVENMVVGAGERRTGTGRVLIEFVVERAWAASCYKVQLQSDNAREGAHTFYERNGFAASSRGYRRYR